MTFGAILPTARLLGGELGTAGIGTYVRVREQIASNLPGLHVRTGSALADERLRHYAAAIHARARGASGGQAQATALLARTVATQARVQSFVDSFALVGLIIFAGLFLVALLCRAPDGPASPRLFGRGRH